MYSFVFVHFVAMQVKMLVQGENGKLRAALVANLKSAVVASFLMLPESFSEEELFLQIAGLSYAGKHLHSREEDKEFIFATHTNSLNCGPRFMQ